MVHCIICGSVPNCHGIYFPKCEQKRLKWIRCLKLDPFNVKKWTRLCRRHFSKNDYPKRILISYAVPSVDIIFETDDKDNLVSPIQHCKEITSFQLFQSPVNDTSTYSRPRPLGTNK